MFIDPRLKKCNIKGKGTAFVTRNNIKKGEVLIEDVPYMIRTKNYPSDIFCMLHQILNDNEVFIEKFMNLYPKTLQEYSFDITIKRKIHDELKQLKKKDVSIYNFLIKRYTMEQIYLFCAKYICNGFDYNNTSSFLFVGTLLNHSCLPNVIFGEKDNKMVFVAARDILKNEEICDNYIDLTLSTNERKNLLNTRYGFVCTCQRCTTNCKPHYVLHDDAVDKIIRYKTDLFIHK